MSYYFGEVSEWLKVHAWKACVGVSLPGVRISPSPHRLEKGNKSTGVRPANGGIEPQLKAGNLPTIENNLQQMETITYVKQTK